MFYVAKTLVCNPESVVFRTFPSTYRGEISNFDESIVFVEPSKHSSLLLVLYQASLVGFEVSTCLSAATTREYSF